MNYKIVEFDGSSHRKVLTETGVEICLFYLDPNGLYYFEPLKGKMYSSYNLKEIAELLYELNKEQPLFFKDNKVVQEEKDYIIDEFTGIVYPKNSK